MAGFEVAPDNKGFHITFENGCTVSIQIGVTNYCDNRNYEIDNDYRDNPGPCANAEIAAWHNNTGEWIRPDYENWGDDVQGWQTPAQVLRFINYVAERA